MKKELYKLVLKNELLFLDKRPSYEDLDSVIKGTDVLELVKFLKLTLDLDSSNLDLYTFCIALYVTIEFFCGRT